MGHFVTEETLLTTIIGRVGISITLLRGFRNVLIDDFSNQHDLDMAIRASCHLPSPNSHTTFKIEESSMADLATIAPYSQTSACESLLLFGQTQRSTTI